MGNKIDCKDYHATSNVKPILDENQDYELLSSSISGSVTTIVFKRPIKLCDGGNDYNINSNTVRMIWSISTTQEPAYHDANRGGRSVNLLEPLVERTDLD